MKRLDFIRGISACTASFWLSSFSLNPFQKMTSQTDFDVLIVGGSYAGLSAAMSLGRAMRNVLIVDSGLPCNRQTPHSHNVITLDGSTPAQITASAKQQVLAYPTVAFKQDTVTAITGSNHAFKAITASGDTIHVKKVLFATGIKDLMPSIPGFAQCWGISVIHCPYCHGYEYRHQPTGILVNGPNTLDFGKLVRNWTKDLTIFTNGQPTFPAEHKEELQTLNIKLVTQEIKEVVHKEGKLKYLLLADESHHTLDALYARLPFEQHSFIPQEMNCAMTEMGFIQTDEFRRTTITGVYAAGDNSAMLRSVTGAMSSGTFAGAFINHDLITEGF